MVQHLIDYAKRGHYDELYTPYDVACDFASFWIAQVPGVVWEPTDHGLSQITRAFRELGVEVVSTHLNTGHDFLTCHVPKCDSIVTNPPYSKKDDFLKRCFEIGKPFALLLPITALSGKTRGELFKTNGISLRVYSERVDFSGSGNPWFSVAWFYWIPGHEARIDFV